MKSKIRCKKCGNAFESFNRNPKFCSIKCKGLSQRHSVDDYKVSVLYKSGMTKIEVAEHIGVTRKVVENSMKRSGTKARIAAKRNQWGSANTSWKGGRANKSNLHKRLYRRFGKPDKCMVCETIDSEHFDYANLTGNYSDPLDYMAMCRSCHWKYDNKIENITGQGGKIYVGE